MTFDKDFSLEHKFEPQIKRILADQFITKDVTADLEKGQDFAIYKVEPFTVGVRLRRYKYYWDFRHQFTIRWSRPSGVSTEIHKIFANEVDYILYGFINSEETEIIQYFIGNLTVFRETKAEPCHIFPNEPYDSELAVYELKQFPSNFVVKFWGS